MLPCIIFPCDPESIEKRIERRESVCVRACAGAGESRARNTKFLVLSRCEIGITDSAVGAPRGCGLALGACADGWTSVGFAASGSFSLRAIVCPTTSSSGAY